MKQVSEFPFQQNANQSNNPAGEDSSSDMTSESLFATSDMGFNQALHSCSTSKGHVVRGLKTARIHETQDADCPHESSKRSQPSGRGASESGLMKPAKKPCSGNGAPSPLDRLLVLHKVAVDMLECWSHNQETPNQRTGKPVLSTTKSPVIGLVHEMEIAYNAAQCRQPARRRSRSELHGPCDHCGVQESPQWRKGPKCKPILCNACGTRFLRTRSLGRQAVRNGHKATACPGEADETTGQVGNLHESLPRSVGGTTSPVPGCRRQAEAAVAADLPASAVARIQMSHGGLSHGEDFSEARTSVGDRQSAASSDVGLSHRSPGLVAGDIESGQLFFMRCRQALSSSPNRSEDGDSSMPGQDSAASPQQACGKKLTPLLALLQNTRGQNHPTQMHALFQSHARARSVGPS